jgi:hypothetical protein
MCTDVFGPQFDRDYLEGRVAAVNDLYGGREHFNVVLCCLLELSRKSVTVTKWSGTPLPHM